MRVLLIEDDPAQASSIELSLANEGIIADKAHLGKDGIEISKLYDYSLIILDLMLPDISGYEVLLSLRSQKIQTPVLILSGLSTIDNKIKGLSFGADDYITKPFDSDELSARVKAIIRRSKGHSEAVIRVGHLSINLDTRSVSMYNKDKQKNMPIHLTNKEYKILELLAIKKGTVLTKEMFLSHLYSGIDEPEIKIIDVFICKLRRKLEKASNGINFIETVWGRGYIFAEFKSNDNSYSLNNVEEG